MGVIEKFNYDFKCSVFKEKEGKPKDELIYKFIQVFVGEFLGTGMLVFWGCACMGEINEGGQTIRALMFGIIFGLCIQIFGLDTTCHLNPAITLTYIIFGDVSLVLGLFYMLSQVLGAIIGYALLECTRLSTLLMGLYLIHCWAISAPVLIQHPSNSLGLQHPSSSHLAICPTVQCILPCLDP
nr:aquaporin-2-like [Halyomorpha halys]